MFSRVFGYLWAAYTYVIFAIVALFAAIFSFILITFSGDKQKRKAHLMPKYSSKLILFLTGMRYQLIGDQLNKNGQYVYVANHVNNIDVLYVRSIINTYLKVLAKQEITKIPLLNYMGKHMAIFINRHDKTDRKRGISEMNEQIQQSKASVLIYPEGTRNKKADCLLLPFKNGAFITAIENQLPIACITLKGIRERMHPTKFLSFPGSLKAYVNIFETKGMQLADLENLKEKVRSTMMQYLSGQPTVV